MNLFPKALKLYHFWGRDRVTLAIRSSDCHVLTFHMESQVFQKMIQESYQPKGFEDGSYFVLIKEGYVRFSKRGKEFDTHFRIDKQKWADLVSDYNQKLKEPAGDYFMCEIE